MANTEILVVDDEVGVTRLCDRFLSRAGYAVVTANHPQEGINLLQHQPIDLLLVDIRMPTMDGFQILNLARQYQPGIAVVIMTGYGTVETALESLHQGADGMVLKPFSGAELVQTIKQALRNRQREREILHLQALRPLFSISELIFAEKSADRLRERLLQIVAEHLDCVHVSFYHQVEAQNTWQQLMARGTVFDLSAHQSDYWCNLTETKSCSLEEIQDLDLTEALRNSEFGFVICVPLYSSKTRQFLFAARDRSASALGEAELETLRILSRQALLALENAQLYDELQERIDQVEASQQALVQAEKMAAVGRLTASIAHEINNPLHSVRNCLHLAGRPELPEADRQEYLELASEEMARLIRTVRQMLDFYRPSALDRKPFDINETIDRVLNLLGAQLSQSEVQVQREFGADLPLVLGVENQIQQVFFNLLLNAMEAIIGGGEIFIKTTAEADEVVIFIEDTGPGISVAQRDEIFEPFVSSKEKGLGLGLTVSYGVVTAHGGTLTLLPEGARGGARFRFSLPAYSV